MFGAVSVFLLTKLGIFLKRRGCGKKKNIWTVFMYVDAVPVGGPFFILSYGFARDNPPKFPEITASL